MLCLTSHPRHQARYRTWWYDIAIRHVQTDRITDDLQVFSNTRFFSRASGHRPDALIVLLVTFAFMFLSSYVLPYVPTIMASTLVLSIGIELVRDALWVSTEDLLWYEWIVVLGTTIGCSVLGFVPGIGVGLIIVMMVLPCWHQIVDSVSVLVTRPSWS